MDENQDRTHVAIEQNLGGSWGRGENGLLSRYGGQTLKRHGDGRWNVIFRTGGPVWLDQGVDER